MLAPAKHRISVKEYYRMAEIGVLDPDARVELLDGEIIELTPPSPFHSGVTIFLNELFWAASTSRWIMGAHSPVHLDAHSEPQPDLMLLKPSSNFYRKRHPRPEDVFLLVEISDTSLEKDREKNFPPTRARALPKSGL